MRFLNSLKRERLGFLLIIALLASGFVLVVMEKWIESDISLISRSWHRFALERSEKVQLVIALRRELGYGGMIHQYKNFVLRGDETRGTKVETGIDLAREARRKNSRLKILFTSGYPEPEWETSELPEANFIFLKKPYLANDLAGALRSLLVK